MARNRTKRELISSAGKVRRLGRTLLQALLAIVIVIIGVVVAVLFIKFRKPPQRIEKDVLAPLVEAKQMHVQDIPMVIRGYGTVSPKVQIEIVPEVAGKVVSVHPELKAGGFIRAGEQLLQINPRDYELAVQQAEAAVADAQVRIDTELAEAEVARREWHALHGDEPASPLVLREPQTRQARAMLESAKAQLEIAKLKLERTSLSLPFEALIISEKVDLGQYIVVGQSLGVAYGVESFEVEVPLEDKELAWFDVFGSSISTNDNKSSVERILAKIKADFAGAEHTWQGYVTRTTGQVDRTSRTVSVVVEVPNPFDNTHSRPPLLPGAFVEVLIQGRTLSSALAIPRDAIHEGNRVWVVNDNRLHVKELVILRADEEFAYTVSGLDDKAVVVVSSLDTVIEGMEVRTQLELAADVNQLETDYKENKREEFD